MVIDSDDDPDRFEQKPFFCSHSHSTKPKLVWSSNYNQAPKHKIKIHSLVLLFFYISSNWKHISLPLTACYSITPEHDNTACRRYGAQQSTHCFSTECFLMCPHFQGITMQGILGLLHPVQLIFAIIPGFDYMTWNTSEMKHGLENLKRRCSSSWTTINRHCSIQPVE